MPARQRFRIELTLRARRESTNRFHPQFGGVPAPQVGEGEQSPAARAQPAPAGDALPAMVVQPSGQEAHSGAGHVDPGRVDKHAKQLVEREFLVDNPSTRGFC